MLMLKLRLSCRLNTVDMSYVGLPVIGPPNENGPPSCETIVANKESPLSSNHLSANALQQHDSSPPSASKVAMRVRRKIMFGAAAAS